ncbi:MAG: potassium channel family protein [Gaiellaceae bacterium]
MTERGGKGLDVARKAGRLSHPQNIIERRMSKFLREPPSVRLAANVIVTATALVVVIGGVMMRVLDHKDYASIWLGMWWVLQTVTTVGYGDLTPKDAIGKILTSIVMLWGIAFLAIITAAITSVFVARAQRERELAEAENVAGGRTVDDRLDHIDGQLEQLRELLDRKP